MRCLEYGLGGRARVNPGRICGIVNYAVMGCQRLSLRCGVSGWKRSE